MNSISNICFKNLKLSLLYCLVLIGYSCEHKGDIENSTVPRIEGYVPLSKLPQQTQDFINSLQVVNAPNNRVGAENIEIVSDSVLVVFNEPDSTSTYSFSVVNYGDAERVIVENLVIHDKGGAKRTYIFRYIPDIT